MARLRRWRGSWLDPFRHSAERQLDRRLLVEYEGEIERLIAGLDRAGYDLAVKLASLPEKIRGFGRVRAASASAVASEREALVVATAPAARAA
jgi:indolepyruvate ferredoxin oxidoreductase